MCSTPVIKSVCTHGNLERGQASDPDKVKRYDLEKVKVKWTPQRWVKQGVIYVVVKCCPSKGVRLGATCRTPYEYHVMCWYHTWRKFWISYCWMTQCCVTFSRHLLFQCMICSQIKWLNETEPSIMTISIVTLINKYNLKNQELNATSEKDWTQLSLIIAVNESSW